MKKLSIVVLMLVGSLQWAAPVMAQGHFRGHHMMGDGPGMMLPLILKQLTLTDAQNTQIQGIMEDYRATVQPLFQQLKTLREGMADKFYASGDLTADDFTSQTQQTSLLQEQIKNAGLNAALNVRAVLTPDQLAQAAQIKSQMQALWAQMHSSSQGQ
jgi:Spy/CpxP family protein refolding chaperone